MNHRHALRARAAVLGLAAAALLLPATLEAQFTEAPAPAAYALRNVTIVRGDGATERDQTIVVRGGRIDAIGRNVPVPADARVIAGDSLYVYPGLIDAAGTLKFEFPRDTTDRSRVRSWDPPRVTQGFMPSRRVLDHFTANGADGAELRKKGVVALAIHPPLTEPLMSGRGTFVVLRRNASTPQQLVVQPELAPMLSLRGGRGVYPATGMAVLAWYRQTFMDAQRQLQLVSDPAGPSAFDADMAVVQNLLRSQGRVFFAANTADEIRRALALTEEFRLKPVIVGGAEAWKVASELRTRNVPVLVSLDFARPRRWKPDEKPDSTKPMEPAAAREKKQLEETYANAGKLAQAGVTFALVSGGRADLREGARKVVEYGLSENDAIRALTTTPAVLLDAPQLARLQAGGSATFIVTDAPLLAKDTRILHTFVEGAHERGAEPRAPRANGDTARTRTDSAAAAVNAAGTWRLEFSGEAPMREMTLTLTQEGTRLTGTMSSPQGDMAVSGSMEGSTLTLNGTFQAGGQSIPIEMVGTVNGNEMTGALKTSFGDLDFKARRTGGRS